MGEGVDTHLRAEHDVRAEGKRACTPSDEALSASPSSSNKHHKLDKGAHGDGAGVREE